MSDPHHDPAHPDPHAADPHAAQQHQTQRPQARVRQQAQTQQRARGWSPFSVVVTVASVLLVGLLVVLAYSYFQGRMVPASTTPPPAQQTVADTTPPPSASTADLGNQIADIRANLDRMVATRETDTAANGQQFVQVNGRIDNVEGAVRDLTDVTQDAVGQLGTLNTQVGDLARQVQDIGTQVQTIATTPPPPVNGGVDVAVDPPMVGLPDTIGAGACVAIAIGGGDAHADCGAGAASPPICCDTAPLPPPNPARLEFDLGTVPGAVCHGEGCGNEIECRRSEQDGCIEFDLQNLRWDSNNPLLAGLDRPATTDAETRRRVTTLGEQLFGAFMEGDLQAAPEQVFYVYMWNVGDTPAENMGMYELLTRQSTTSAWMEVEEVPPTTGPAETAEYDLGPPQRAFRVTARGGVVAFQVPWSMIGDTTYVLICPEAETIYPNRTTDSEGIWFTPEYLRDMRNADWDYVLVPFLT